MRESFHVLHSNFSEDVRLSQTVHQSESLLPNQTDPSEVGREGILNWLSKNVPDARLHHILRVEEMASRLARHHRLDEKRAAQAGLLHDLAKFFKPRRLLSMAKANKLELDPVEEANPHLLHAEIGAIVARDKFGVRDEAVLQAVRNHTVGRPGMSPLCCVVFLADSLEPGRGDSSELDHLRQLSYQDLYRAVWYTCDYSLRHLVTSRHLIHPRAILTRNWAMQVARGKEGGEKKEEGERKRKKEEEGRKGRKKEEKKGKAGESGVAE